MTIKDSYQASSTTDGTYFGAGDLLPRRSLRGSVGAATGALIAKSAPIAEVSLPPLPQPFDASKYAVITEL